MGVGVGVWKGKGWGGLQLHLTQSGRKFWMRGNGGEYSGGRGEWGREEGAKEKGREMREVRGVCGGEVVPGGP